MTLPTEFKTQLPASQADRFQALREKAQNESSVMWQPAENETLVGAIEGHESASGLYGDGHLMLVRDERGQLFKVWLTKWLKDNLQGQNAAQGDLLALTFLGKKITPSGKLYNAYNLIIEKMDDESTGE